MAGSKGTLKTIGDAVEDVVHAVAVATGITPEAPPEPKSKTARKAARKATIVRAEETKKVIRRAYLSRARTASLPQ